MTQEAQEIESARERIGRLFKFLQEFQRINVLPTLHFKNYDWSLVLASLPNYPTISVGQPPVEPTSTAAKTPQPTEESTDVSRDYVLKIKRPKETDCPAPPSALREWLQVGWQQLGAEPKVVAAKNCVDAQGKTIVEKFEDSAERQQLFDKWLLNRKQWEEAEIPVRQASTVFSMFFELWGKFQRESEKFQLYLGDGFLAWDHPEGEIRHPLLLQRVELNFDPSIPEFVVKESDSAPELYSSLLRHCMVDGKGLAECREQLKNNGYHPLDGEQTSGFLRYLVQRFWRDGEFFDKDQNGRQATTPFIYRSPSLFLGDRHQGFVEALERFTEGLPQLENLPSALLRLVGFETKLTQPEADGLPGSNGTASQPAVPEVDLLLTKPANAEQERIIRRLAVSGTVLVQGPPGTGKSHTIANLIGHLLAQNKTILVASETSKALKVVREKVAPNLRALCVSVLDKDEESRKLLEESVTGIVNYFSRTDREKLASEITELSKKRDELKDRLRKLSDALLRACRDEYTDIVVGGQGIAPAQVARLLADYRGTHDWIPGPVEEGSAIPLSSEELAELYASNKVLGLEEEQILASRLPDIDLLPSPEMFTAFVEERAQIEATDRSVGEDFWQNDQQTVEMLDQLDATLKTTVAEIDAKAQWLMECVEAGRKDGIHRQQWNSLISQIQMARDEIVKRQDVVLSVGPKRNGTNVKDGIKICCQIIDHLEAGGSLNVMSTLFRPTWKAFVLSFQVFDGTPAKAQHFLGIKAFIEIEEYRRQLINRWNEQMGKLGAPTSKELGNRPEEAVYHFAERLKSALKWYPERWKACELQLSKDGFNWEKLTQAIALPPSSTREILCLLEAVHRRIGPILQSRRAKVRQLELESLRKKWLGYGLDAFSEKEPSYPLVKSLKEAISKGDYVGYSKAMKKLMELTSLNTNYRRRYDLLKKLGAKASGWTASIKNRQPPHDEVTIPGDVELAWKNAQWDQAITRRCQVDLDALQREMTAVKDELQNVTAQYVERLSWNAQWNRIGLKQQQALNGWLGVQKKMRGGHGKRVPILLEEAKRLLAECRSAVPVWIMPLSRVVESFDLLKTRFDVVILDEASQSDVRALIAFAIANEIVVVGDHEQVSPYGVGQEIAITQSLIDDLLKGIPNKQLYDGKTSVYDLAQMSFGETIRLVEHFRCVPDIIQFSNELCYNNEIKPLRESANSPLLPHVVAHRVDGVRDAGKVNVEEATAVASLIAAICETREYDGCSIGAISLLGTEQADCIDKILRARLPVSEYQKRNLLCGNASQFQGDERDVTFLSMVSSPDNGPLPLLQREEAKRVFNVAASRAKNQLWVVHSLNPDTDLKPGDLRLRLIKHAEDPQASRRQNETGQKKADSEFERLVLSDLTSAGYRVVCQWEVGAYSIDLVALGLDGKKVAIECDGDRFHPQEKLSADMARQMVLERLGWKFVRIRGTEYFRNRTATIQRVVRRLAELGISPIGAKTEAQPMTDSTNDLRSRVIRKAQEIRDRWKNNPIDSREDLDESKIGRSWFKRRRHS